MCCDGCCLPPTNLEQVFSPDEAILPLELQALQGTPPHLGGGVACVHKTRAGCLRLLLWVCGPASQSVSSHPASLQHSPSSWLCAELVLSQHVALISSLVCVPVVGVAAAGIILVWVF